jgi:hypothetical protein
VVRRCGEEEERKWEEEVETRGNRRRTAVKKLEKL